MGAITPIASGLGALNSVAGGVLPILGAASQIVGTVQTLSGPSSAAEQQDLALRQLQERQRVQQQQLAAQIELDNLKSRALDLDLSQTNSLNVLQATQLGPAAKSISPVLKE